MADLFAGQDQQGRGPHKAQASDPGDRAGKGDAGRPLADRLRPASLSEVVGQPHLTGPDGVLTVSYTHLTLPTICSV